MGKIYCMAVLLFSVFAFAQETEEEANKENTG